MNILVTGGAGFIGANFIRYMLSTYNYTIVNLDQLTYAGNLNNLNDIAHKPNYHFVHGNINDKELVNQIFHDYDIQTVINFAAESHVDRSIENPSIFFETNVLGTENLLEVSKSHWKVNSLNPNCREYKTGVKFIQISTDEVYGTLGEEGFFTEETNLAPNSPYSASKASADMIVRAYNATFGIPVLITRCSNNYGPYQYPEKLIPLIIERALKNEPIPIYGDGNQVRDWLYVEDHCLAIDRVLHKGEIGEVYNIGGNNEKKNIEIVKIILALLQKNESLIEFVEDRLGHDQRYAIDNSKISRELEWTPAFTFEQGIEKTIEWYLANKAWMESIKIGDKIS
ncbi:dTDP-glucose 4,6-dehydratase [Sporosarcina sp. 6E9]|uniref:dTDP-glucose 4,6-dehydratase n=1 Tax=Sporosarcina sp. 6E9 TaxID=2819235 RepID=UPI001B3181F9|nr:dTDP-glucose 4,6-dehydratase [Sporosarcina sp. 6E9]